jgi:CBS domain containing-hemolysin-like protein
MDVIALDINTPFPEVLKTILEHGYSRIPVYKENFDQIEGLLYIKDLLPHLEEEASFPWNTLLRPAFFIPENKKLDDLLSEFQSRKIHMSIVVDEYGGANGIATLEDVLEEILGEISDEFDDEDLTYSKLDARNYVFEGKILLRDFYRVLQIEGDAFEEVKGESDTLAGFVLEISGRIPTKNEVIHFDDYQMRIESVDKRRIKRIKVTYVGT